MLKPALLTHLTKLLQQKLSAIEAEIASTLHARNSDTKSSAGDKHEVGRAMVQQELDQQEMQREKVIVQLQELARVPMDRTFDRVGFGSLVNTDAGLYFIAIGLGRIELAGETCSVVSLASPIGQALLNKRVGDVIKFNGRLITISQID